VQKKQRDGFNLLPKQAWRQIQRKDAEVQRRKEMNISHNQSLFIRYNLD
jgi:hypothetical protein